MEDFAVALIENQLTESCLGSPGRLLKIRQCLKGFFEGYSVLEQTALETDRSGLALIKCEDYEYDVHCGTFVLSPTILSSSPL